jgi:hypothetical protein
MQIRNVVYQGQRTRLTLTERGAIETLNPKEGKNFLDSVEDFKGKLAGKRASARGHRTHSRSQRFSNSQYLGLILGESQVLFQKFCMMENVHRARLHIGFKMRSQVAGGRNLIQASFFNLIALRLFLISSFSESSSSLRLG